jgi:hypothetical protein
MDIYWDTIQFDKEKCHGTVTNDGKGTLTVNGSIKENVNQKTKVLYWASNPMNTRYSFSGSGLPYHSPEQAYSNSVNVGSVNCVNGQFNFTIKFPNSYYLTLGTIYVPPHVHIKLYNGETECDYYSIKLGNGLKYRSLSSPPERTGAEFYDNVRHLPFRSQEQILRDSAMCSVNAPANCNGHFGLKPAM